MYIDDCIDGTLKLMESEIYEPINIGSEEMVSINQLVSIVEDISGMKLIRKYKLDAPKGVRGRSSDNTYIKENLNWSPSILLLDGMKKTFQWIESEIIKKSESV